MESQQDHTDASCHRLRNQERPNGYDAVLGQALGQDLGGWALAALRPQAGRQFLQRECLFPRRESFGQ
jgi:hypothetical protein